MQRKSVQTERLPLLPLKDMIVFPRMVVPLLVGRPPSLSAVEEALATDTPLLLCAQRDESVEEPQPADLYEVGVAASILQTMRMPDNTMKVVVEGMGRARLHNVFAAGGFLEAEVSELEVRAAPDREYAVLMRTAINAFEEYVRQSQRVSPEIVSSMRSVEDPSDLADLIAAYLPVAASERQEVLEITEVGARLEHTTGIFLRENEMLDQERRVRDRVREQMDRGQREHYLQEQLRAIHQELGSRGEEGDEFTELRALIEKAKMSKEANEKAERELGRYERMPPMSPEGTVIRTYIEWLTDLPWQKRTKDKLDIPYARKVLDEDHYGLEKVKDRILEFLAVRKLSKSTRGPVLCLVGPPGVGKTSLGKSIARAMGRKFVRISLGGVRDEAEIRGHRRTYIGAMPGRIIQSVKRAGVKNPVFMLDEIDKMNMDFRGDPASALLEVLDPEQNRAFSDHYLEVDYDLHEVFFITTANSEYDIPGPLHDRMEVVRLSGYTQYEKTQIARGFLIPKQCEESGLKDDQITFADDGLDLLIRRYTEEAGVRELERQIANVCRKVARRVVENDDLDAVDVTAAKVQELLGPEEYSDLKAEDKALVGLSIGLAWTWTGGDILTIETSTMRGKGDLQLTGQLGEVMRESAQAAHSYIRAHATELEVPPRFYQTTDLHLHVPEGAIPKDGPSAGTALAVSMLSALTKRPPKVGLAMTGEITLRGRVLEVGGIKEKVLAAHRAGIKTVVMPKDNEKDLRDVPKEVKQALEFILVEEIGQVLEAAFDPKKAPKRKKKPAARKRSAR